MHNGPCLAHMNCGRDSTDSEERMNRAVIESHHSKPPIPNQRVYRILVINPGSTSTRISIFDNDRSRLGREISHSVADLRRFESIMDQLKYREELILDELSKSGYSLEDIDSIIARGGALKPLPSGTYRISGDMIDDLESGRYGLHASNLGAVLADRLARRIEVPAFIVDPITVSELSDIARVSGIPDIERESIFHALNQKAVARRAAREMEIEYSEARFIVAHLGGGISVGAHDCGKVVDVNNALNGDGPFAPTRSGSVPEWSLIKLVLSGKYTEEQLKKMIMSAGGMAAYLGTSDLREVAGRIRNGDEKADLVYRAMAYQVAKEIGSCAAVLRGSVDAIVLAGGLARDGEFVNLICERVSFIAKILIYPGSDEMLALALGALRVLTGAERERDYLSDDYDYYNKSLD